MLRSLGAAWALLRALGHVLGGVWTLRRRFPGLDAAQRAEAVRQWIEQDRSSEQGSAGDAGGNTPDADV